MTTTQETDTEGTGVDQRDKIIAACRDCGFVSADRVAGYEYSVRGTRDDPGFRHYKATGHSCGTFEPTDGSPLDEQWQVAYGVEAGDLMEGPEVYELAMGVEDGAE